VFSVSVKKKRASTAPTTSPMQSRQSLPVKKTEERASLSGLLERACVRAVFGLSCFFCPSS